MIKINLICHLSSTSLGVWKIPNEITADTVYNAIKLGYRLFDGAFGASILPALKCSLYLIR